MSSAGTIAQDKAWKDKEQSAEARYIHEKQNIQLAALRAQPTSGDNKSNQAPVVSREDRDYEAGFGGQDELEDRYATTNGEH